MFRRAAILLLAPALCGLDGAGARETLALALHNLHGADVLAGVELRVEAGGESTLVEYAYGRQRRGGETRTLLFSSDGSRDGPRALLFQHPERPDRIFVSEGARGRVRPLPPGERGWALFGSDFAYEDIRARGADDFAIEVLGEDQAQGEPCLVLRLRPDDGPYAALVAWISKERPVFLRVDYFDGEGLWKRYRAEAERVVAHYEWWVPMRDEMLDLRKGSRTRRTVRNILVDTAVPDELFTTTTLARGRMPRF